MKLSSGKSIILASTSPRRKELLENIGCNLFVVPSLFDEKSIEMKSSREYCEKLSYCKASVVAEDYPNSWIIGADTIISIDGNILGKPYTKQNARVMLGQLSGKIHQVYTGYTILCSNKNIVVTKSVLTQVKFKQLNVNEIKYYVDTGESLDKSGGYAIQGMGAFIIKKIDGSYTNVMGLPMCEIVKDLIDLNLISFGNEN